MLPELLQALCGGLLDGRTQRHCAGHADFVAAKAGGSGLLVLILVLKMLLCAVYAEALSEARGTGVADIVVIEAGN